MPFSQVKLDQEIIQNILFQVYERSQKDDKLDSNKVVKEMVKELKSVINSYESR